MPETDAFLMDDKISVEIDMNDCSTVSEALLRQAKDIGMGLTVFMAIDSNKGRIDDKVAKLQHMQLIKKFTLELDYTKHTAKVQFIGKLVYKLPNKKKEKKLKK